jgi:hypothetical protein
VVSRFPADQGVVAQEHERDLAWSLHRALGP